MLSLDIFTHCAKIQRDGTTHEQLTPNAVRPRRGYENWKSNQRRVRLMTNVTLNKYIALPGGPRGTVPIVHNSLRLIVMLTFQRSENTSLLN